VAHVDLEGLAQRDGVGQLDPPAPGLDTADGCAVPSEFVGDVLLAEVQPGTCRTDVGGDQVVELVRRHARILPIQTLAGSATT
jgi:hypothetical protein